MKKTAFALLAAGVSWGALSACGEKHDILGSRVDGGGPGGGTAGSGGSTGGKGGAAGSATGGSGGVAGRGAGGNGTGGTGGGQAGVGAGGEAGGSGGAAGGSGGAGGNGASAGTGDAGTPGAGSGGNAGEGGGGSGGTAGTGTAGSGTAGTGGGGMACPTDCTRGTTAGCTAGQIGWSCGAQHDYQELIDGGCTDRGTSLPSYCCPPEFYSDCGSCASETTLEACDARSDCHPVFTDPNTCGCAAIGCCARFSHCAEVGLAMCTGTVTCAAPAPYCEGPAYVISYVNGCYEGCVRAEDCALN